MAGLFYVHQGNTGVEWTPDKSQHTKLTLEKKFLPPLLPGFELATFRARVWRSTNMLSRLPEREFSSLVEMIGWSFFQPRPGVTTTVSPPGRAQRVDRHKVMRLLTQPITQRQKQSPTFLLICVYLSIAKSRCSAAMLIIRFP